MAKAGNYTPWRRDLALSRFFLVVPPLAAVAVAYLHPALMAGCAAVGLFCLLVGWRLHVRAGSRRYGQAVEAKFSHQAIARLQRAGFGVETGRMTKVGDVDLIVRRGAWSVTVEIKSFWYWRGRFRDRARQRKARSQARRQREVVGADRAVIWLPNARRNWLSRLLDWLLPERNPVVVVGSAAQLEAALHRLFPE